MTSFELEETEMDLVMKPAMKIIPSPDFIRDEAIENIDKNKLKKTYVETHFSEIVDLVMSSVYRKFISYQKLASKSLIETYMQKYSTEIEKSKFGNNKLVRTVLESFEPLARQFEFRLGQMRKNRAGSDFENIIVYLLGIIGIQCEKTSRLKNAKLNRIDIVLPDRDTAINKPDKAIFLTLKHTLRERWKQSLPEQKRGWIMYVLTLDENISNDKANEMNEIGLIMYVKDELKARPHISEKRLIRKLSDLPNALNFHTKSV